MDAADLDTTAPLLGEPLPVELMNTIWADREGAHDALREDGDLAGWLRAVRQRFLPPMSPDGPVDDPGPAPQLARQFRQLRNALRYLAAVATGDQRPAAASDVSDLAGAVTVVNQASAVAPGWSELAWPEGGAATRTSRSSRAYPAAALSRIAEQAVDLFTGADLVNLRTCQGPGCVLYFVRNHSRREWCSAGCGNRARVARHYQRHHIDAKS